MREHLGDRESVVRRFPARVLLTDLRHQPAQDRRRGFEQVEAGQLVVHDHYPTMLSPPSTRRVFPVIQYVAGWQSATRQCATSSGVVSLRCGLRRFAISMNFS
jgi:hypothetical protein